jgi:formylglycine-generating enzyme required for sulfatase activity
MTRLIWTLALLVVLLTACGKTPQPTAAPSTTRILLPPVPSATHAPPTTAVLPNKTEPPTSTPVPPTYTQVPSINTPMPAHTSTAVLPTATRTHAPATSTPTVIPTMLPVEVVMRTRSKDGRAMVYVPAGEFPMGSTGAANLNEKPQHTVYLDAFWIDRTEVTMAQYRLFTKASGYQTRAEEKGWAYAWVESAKEWQKVNGADWQHPFGPESSVEQDHPVVQVTWADAAAYCTWAGGSLPTEAQWEKAARGTDGRKYPWGNTFDGTWLNYCDSTCEGGDSAFDDGYRFTAPVGSYPSGVSPYGALDMAGNVWEWTADWYDDSYYAISPAQNPTGPESGQYRVLRGGSWNHDQSGMRTTFRLDSSSDESVDNFGFRCAWQE